jgi:hypothetical protein
MLRGGVVGAIAGGALAWTLDARLPVHAVLAGSMDADSGLHVRLDEFVGPHYVAAVYSRSLGTGRWYGPKMHTHHPLPRRAGDVLHVPRRAWVDDDRCLVAPQVAVCIHAAGHVPRFDPHGHATLAEVRPSAIAVMLR